MNRGELWWARLPAPSGRRPVVLVSRDSAYAVRTSITVAEVTTTIRGIRSEVPLSKRDGLDRKCVINADNVLTLPKGWLEAKISTLSREKSNAFDEALRFSLGLE